MSGVYLVAHGGLDCLVVRDDIAVPGPGVGEVLINVTAAGMNNTDINTRTGWYHQSVTSGTTAQGGTSGFGVNEQGMGDWEGGLDFPRIQGADVVGRIVKTGFGVDQSRLGERVVCDPYIRDPDDIEGLESAGFLGSEHNGGFAQFCCVPSENAVSLPENLNHSDAALATLPCSGGTAMNMLRMAGAREGDLALVTGASGGVGTFLVQILKAKGAEVIGVASAEKQSAVTGLGADHVIGRGDHLIERVMDLTRGRRLSLVADVVGGAQFPDYLKLLRRGGRYVTAGAIAGPLVGLDLRTLYLKNLSLFGSTVYLRGTFAELLDMVISGQVKPFVADTWPLEKIHDAQAHFLRKRHVGSLVLIPGPME